MVLHLRRGPDGVRRLAEVGVPVRGRDGLVVVEPAVTFPPVGPPEPGPGADTLARRLPP